MLMIHDIPTPLNFFFCYQRNHPALTKKEKKERGYNADAKLLNFQLNSE